MTLPIGGRIALPPSINTYISVVKNTSLMYVIGYEELTTTAYNINALSPRTLETFGTLAVDLPAIVWTMSGLDPLARVAAALSGGALMPELGRARCALHVRDRPARDTPDRGCGARRQHPDRSRCSGTLLTLDFPPFAGADPVLHRVLARPADSRHDLHRLLRACRRSAPRSSSTPSRRRRSVSCSGAARRSPRPRAARSRSIPNEQHEAAAALGFGWLGRHRFVILPQALRRLLPPLVSLLVNIIQNTTIAQVIGAAELLETGERSAERLTFTTLGSAARPRDLRRGRGRLLPDLVPVDAARRAPGETTGLAEDELVGGRGRAAAQARAGVRVEPVEAGRVDGEAESARRPGQRCARRPGQ